MSPADSPFAQLPAPGPHPATAELRAYAAGTLAPADEHRIEAHSLDCERCADLLEGFSMTDAATTDQAVAELRTRLQARVGTAEPEPVVGGWAWPRIAAAAALLAVLGGGIWGWEQQHNQPAGVATTGSETASPATISAPAPPAAQVPAPARAQEVTVTAVPKAAQESVKEAAKAADYAAVTPARARRAAPLHRASRVARPDADIAADGWSSAAEQEAAPMAAMASPAAKTEAATDSPAAPASSAAAGLAGRVAGVAVQTQTATYDMATADTVAQNDAKKMRFLSAKAKAAAPPAQAVGSAAAPAIVANTPMPASPSINPAPVGGTTALREYLRREAAGFDPEINNLRLAGTVRVQFLVGADGKISNLKVVRGLRSDYDSEALRIVCEGPAWQPGIAGGKRAPLPMEVTVPF